MYYVQKCKLRINITKVFVVCTHSLSYSLTSHFNGEEIQWIKAFGLAAIDDGSYLTNNSTTSPLASF